MSGSAHQAAIERLTAELAPVVSELGLDLEAVELTPAGKRRVLRIAVDKDGGVNLDDIAEADRAVSRVLDDSDAMGEQSYTLEVTSRGVDRPLTLPRHWRRNVGRLVKVTLADGGGVTGRIADADEEAARLDVPGPKKGQSTQHDVAYADAAKAVIQIEFNRPAGRDA